MSAPASPTTRVTTTTTTTTMPAAAAAAPRYDTLAFEGGGVLGVAYAAALAEAHARGLVDTRAGGGTYRFAGTSIGAAMAALLACRITLDGLLDVTERWDARSVRDSYTECTLRAARAGRWWNRWWRYARVPLDVVRDAWRAYTRGGVWRGAALRAMFASEVDRVTGDVGITLAGVHARYGTELVVCAYCVDTETAAYFSHRTHPHMPLVTAVHASMSVPCMFQWVRYGGHRYWDGGLVDNLPMHVYDPRDPRTGARTCEVHAGTLGFKLVGDGDAPASRIDVVAPANLHDAAACASPPQTRGRCRRRARHTLASAVPALANAVMDAAQRQHQHDVDFARTVRIDTHELGAFDFGATDAERRRAMRYAREGVVAFCERWLCAEDGGGDDGGGAGDVDICVNDDDDDDDDDEDVTTTTTMLRRRRRRVLKRV